VDLTRYGISGEGKESLVQAENRTSLQPIHYAGCVNITYRQLD